MRPETLAEAVTEAVAETTEEVVEEVYSLTRQDRCDADKAEAALVVVAREDQILSFCAHHYRILEEVLGLAGWEMVVDERDRLLARPTEDD